MLTYIPFVLNGIGCICFTAGAVVSLYLKIKGIQ